MVGGFCYLCLINLKVFSLKVSPKKDVTQSDCLNSFVYIPRKRQNISYLSVQIMQEAFYKHYF